MQDELKPCPFCGESSECIHKPIEGTYSIECRDCQAQMPYVGLTSEEAITAWNTRVDTHPPTTKPVNDRETPVGDHQMVEAVAMALCEVDGDRWNAKDFTETLSGNDPDDVRAHYFDLAQAALTAARAQVEGENQRLREALEQCRAQFAFYADEHRKADKNEKAATNERFAQIARQALGDEA